MRKKDIFEENKELQSSLFLAQSYQDAWADYGRSLKKERFEKVIREGGTLKDAEGLLQKPDLTKIQIEWLARHIARAEFGINIRLFYYIGSLLNNIQGEKYIDACFKEIGSHILPIVLLCVTCEYFCFAHAK